MRWTHGTEGSPSMSFWMTCAAPEPPHTASLLFAYFRHMGFIDGLIRRFSKTKPKPEIHRLLSILFTQGHFQTGVAKEVASSVAVDYARSVHGPHVAGFVNAVARKGFSASFGEFMNIWPDKASITIPALLLNRWKKRVGVLKTDEIAELIRQRPTTSVRLLRGDSHALTAAGFTQCGDMLWNKRFVFFSAAADHPQQVGKILESGAVYAQDPATALAPSMLELAGGERVFDLCAAPGGKTLMLAELAPNGLVFAFDRSPRRLALVAENLQRLKVGNVRLVVADGIAPPLAADSTDAILLDVPCSNTGVARRRPDALWRFSEVKLRELVELQSRLLAAATTPLASGGKLVYSTCSLEPEENELQVKRFLKANPAFTLLKEMELLPSPEHDGAYAALLGKA